MELLMGLKNPNVNNNENYLKQTNKKKQERGLIDNFIGNNQTNQRANMMEIEEKH